jgi:hypothetical protein
VLYFMYVLYCIVLLVCKKVVELWVEVGQ